MSKVLKPRPGAERGVGGRCAAICAAFAIVAATSGGVRAGETRLVDASGYALVVTPGRTAFRSGAGFLVGLPDNDRRREPVEIEVAVVDPPEPPGLSRCSIWSAWPRCSFVRGDAGGSSGAPVTLEMYDPLDGKLVRYRQTKYADGLEPVFEAIEWRRSGDLRVERAR